MGFNQNSTFGFGSNGGGGGGGSVTGANDGLSLTGTVAKLGQIPGTGGDPAALTENREIPFGGNNLSFIDRGTGDLILFNLPTPGITLLLNEPTFTGTPRFAVANTATNFSFFGDTAGDVIPGFTGDGGFIQYATSGASSTLNFLNSGNVLLFNQIAFPTSDSGDLLQVYGPLTIDVSHASPANNHSFFINSFVDTSGNFQNTSVLSAGYWDIEAVYNGTNGGAFQGNLNLTQTVNFNSGSEEQVGISQSAALNFETASLGTAFIIGIDQDARAQFNLQSATGSPAGAMAIGSGGAYYGSVYFAYRGLNPSSDTTGKLTVINGGSQTTAERPLPLGVYSARTDIDNGGTITLIGNYANFVSDIAIGALGTMDTFIDFSGGGAVNFAATGFTIDTRIAFWAQDLSTMMNVTHAYAFKSEGPNDLFYHAGVMIVGGANPPTSSGSSIQIYATGNNSAVLQLLGDASINNDMVIEFTDTSNTVANWSIIASSIDDGTGFIINNNLHGTVIQITDGAIFNYTGRNAPPVAGNDFNIGGSLEASISLSGQTTSWAAVTGVNSTTYDATAGNLISYGGKFQDASSKSAGANSVISIGVYGTSAGAADGNFAAVFENANVQIASGVASLVDDGHALQVQGDASFTGDLYIKSTPASVSGSVSGTASFNEVQRGSAYKMVVIYLTALNGTATYNFAIPFSHTPVVMSTNGLATTKVTTLDVNHVIVTGTTDTGFLFIEGF